MCFKSAVGLVTVELPSPALLPVSFGTSDSHLAKKGILHPHPQEFLVWLLTEGPALLMEVAALRRDGYCSIMGEQRAGVE